MLNFSFVFKDLKTIEFRLCSLKVLENSTGQLYSVFVALVTFSYSKSKVVSVRSTCLVVFLLHKPLSLKEKSSKVVVFSTRLLE